MELIDYDNHLLALKKPAGIATQPDFHEMAKAWAKEFFKKPGNVFLEPIHRLDKPVSGIVLFARTSKALSRLNEAMRKGQMQKVYLAWVEGIVEERGTLEHFLVHGDFRSFVDPKGKKAVLHFRRLEVKEERSFVEIALETGRYHQIRVQFGAIGHPICGDQKYGAKKAKEKISLHHYQLTFPHPVQKGKVTYQCSALFSF